ncbi:short chain dehydrogenase [Alkalihalobacillus sp. TS-13]|uniref:short chain dehydrogenase n=1 Tax=Alkalihalobacillus sp. TS-13 TaxID=2842455 RepID=UPI001C86AD58|nr:short chain dehydrogenase [Alkalihalobacillus sp. TS-13]
MRLLLVGATGTLGTAVANEMESDADIISAARTNADVKVDITSTESIKEMFNKVGEIDALVCTAGAAHFGPVREMTPEQNLVAVNSKLLGQINLVLLGLDYIRENGSITLTTGILMDDPLVTASSAAMANGGVQAFVRSAAIELPKNIRINNVSPTMVTEAKEKYGSLFKGFKPREAKDVALAYKKSILGAQSGQTYNVY